MGFFRSLLTAPETINKAVGAAIDAGDAIVYTKEEQASGALTQVLAGWKDQYSPRAVTRRFLALMFCGSYLGTIWVTIIQSIIHYTVGLGTEGLLVFLIQVVKYQTWAILAIITFYFGSYGYERVKSLGVKT